ncbi:MAG TPA: glycosyltransferase [Acidobacteriaceae bacterium]|nr:glycosyltransferase [Acidobacteriaceae bacterium]
MLNDVHLWEEPVFEDAPHATLTSATGRGGVRVLTPRLPGGLTEFEAVQAQRRLLDEYVAAQNLDDFIAWYYTPMALRFSDHLVAQVTVYDCMDELSAFQSAPPELIDQEQRLFERADVVFAGGASLFASKRTQHANVHLFPSSIDREHFALARMPQADPPDQAQIPHPRFGFFGVLDERLDRDLLRDVAQQHPEWHFVLIGPVVKVHPEDLPHASNIHYLGQKDYAELPVYIANWDVAMLPFARNASTRFISPTKTPEYLAAGKPVVSTPIHDVVKPYGDLGLVQIAGNAQEFAAAAETCLRGQGSEWLAKVDRFLAGNSWDKTFEHMWKEIQRCMPQGTARSAIVRRADERSGADV